MAEERQKKIALIGAAGYGYGSSEVRVECFRWDRLKKVSNLADYDVVILNLLSLNDPRRLDVGAFRKMLDVRIAQQVLRKSDSGIFVLGDPRFRVECHSNGAKHEEPFLTWTGIGFSWDGRPGDTVELTYEASRGPFKTFADKLSQWNYSLVECRPDEDEYAKVWNVAFLQERGEQPEVVVNKICKNSYGNALIFSVAHAVEHRSSDSFTARYGAKETVSLSNPILFLPENDFSEEEVLEFVLRDLCGVDVSAPEPEWVSEYIAPGQEEVDREIAKLEAHIEKLIADRNSKVEKRDKVRKPLKLLYETGAALEEAVRSVLVELGAEVEMPEGDRTKEDGWVTVRLDDEIFEGVLEIKGVKSKHFSLEGLRQLTDWIERGRTYRRKTYTGIFVGNSFRENPPRYRIWPFNNNWVEQAEMRGYAAIRTEDLYTLYLLDRTGRLDRDKFWRSLFSTKGPFNMRPYLNELTDKEKGQMESLPQE